MAEAGTKLRAGLPKDNGLAPIADELVKDTSQLIVGVVTLGVEDIVNHVKADTQTVVTRISRIEADLNADEATAVLAILSAAQERRTGKTPMIRADGTIAVDDTPPPEEEKHGGEPLTVVEGGKGKHGPDFVEPPEDAADAE